METGSNRVQARLTIYTLNAPLLPPPHTQYNRPHLGSVVRLKLARGEGCGHSAIVTAVLTASLARSYAVVCRRGLQKSFARPKNHVCDPTDQSIGQSIHQRRSRRPLPTSLRIASMSSSCSSLPPPPPPSFLAFCSRWVTIE